MSSTLIRRLTDISIEPTTPDELRRQLASTSISPADLELPGELSAEGEPDTPKLLEAVALLQRYQSHIPPELRIPLIQDLITGDYNQGVDKLKSDIDILRRSNPGIIKVLWMVLDAVILKEGLRLVSDQPIQDFARIEQERQKHGFIRRWLRNKLLGEEEKKAAIVEAGVQAAVKVDLIKKELYELEVKKKVEEQEVGQTIIRATTDIRKMTEIGHQELEQARREKDAIMAEITELKTYRAKLRKDPKLAEYATQERDRRLAVRKSSLQIALEQLYQAGTRKAGDGRVNTIYTNDGTEFLEKLSQEIIPEVEIFDRDFGAEERKLLVTDFIRYLLPLTQNDIAFRLSHSDEISEKKILRDRDVIPTIRSLFCGETFRIKEVQSYISGLIKKLKAL